MEKLTSGKRIRFNVTKKQHLIILKNAAKAGLNTSGYLRQVAINARLIPKWTEEERLIVMRLIGMSKELNQIGELAKEKGIAYVAPLFLKFKEMLEEAANVLSHKP